MSKQRIDWIIAYSAQELNKRIMRNVASNERIKTFQIVRVGELYEAFVLIEQDGGGK